MTPWAPVVAEGVTASDFLFRAKRSEDVVGAPRGAAPRGWASSALDAGVRGPAELVHRVLASPFALGIDCSFCSEISSLGSAVPFVAGARSVQRCCCDLSVRDGGENVLENAGDLGVGKARLGEQVIRYAQQVNQLAVVE